ncbi:MAG: transposase [Eubacterium sp.]|nr:transposase [Eubacterium sp.]
MVKYYKAYRFRIYPSPDQEQQMAKTFGCCRFIHNHMLEDKIREYKENGKMLRTTPAMYKGEFPWLKEVDSLALANVQLQLEAAYKKFFREPSVGFPRFRAKHHSRDSYTTNLVNGNIRLMGRRLKLPKMSPVRIIVHREIPEDGKLKSVTVVREPSGKYYASLLYEFDSCENQAAVKIREDKVLGMDFAMAGLAVFSDGSRADYPMYYRKSEGKLAREQRKLSRCKKGSRNYVKQKRKVARYHEKIRNQRRDFQNKLSFYLSEQYDAVCVEDLNMKGMSRGLHFGKSVMDNANGRFQRILEGKMVRKGKAYVRIDRYFPSSKRCSCCGRIKGDLKLSDRIYECECGYRGDRDINAAINLRQEGIRILHCSGDEHQVTA